MIESNFFRGNRQTLRDELDLQKDDLVLIPSAVRMQFHSEQAAEFLQESNFFYLTGINEPDCLLMMSSKSEWLLIPKQDQFASLWEGQLTPEEAKKKSEIEHVIDVEEGWSLLGRYIPNRVKRVFLLQPEPTIISGGIYTNPSQRDLLNRLQADFPLVSYVDVRPHLSEKRIIKQKPELTAIRRAVDVTLNTMNEVFKDLKSGRFEYELSAQLTYGFKKHGAQGDAYESIVAGGERACVIHYSKKDQTLQKNNFVLIDAGARFDNYAADISRTYLVEGKVSTRQQEILDAVDEVHTFALNYLKPGVRFDQYEEAVEAEMGRVLKNLKLINDVSRDSIRNYYPHATSHFLGLEVHDVGDRSAEFREGMVLTVEPGIYIPEESIGVRFEDNILITATGIENLSKELPLT